MMMMEDPDVRCHPGPCKADEDEVVLTPEEEAEAGLMHVYKHV